MLNIYKKKIVDSTNDWAKRETGTNAVFLAERQTKGRGRLDRKWESSSSGNLYFSIKVPVQEFQQAIHYNFIASLALAEALIELYDFRATIKWPNDLLIEQKKVCGILSEMDLSSAHAKHVIIGMGVNCFFDIKEGDLSQIATSLHLYIESLDKMKLFHSLLKKFNTLNQNYQEKGFSFILNLWEQHAQVVGREIYTSISHKENEKSVKEKVLVIALNKDGSLTVRRRNGNIVRIIAGDVEYAEKCDH